MNKKEEGLESIDMVKNTRQQADFFENIKQHMLNLDIELEAVKQAIEDTLLRIEDTNYNVAQKMGEAV